MPDALRAVDPDQIDAVGARKHEPQIGDERNESAVAPALAGRADRPGKLDGRDMKVPARMRIRERALALGMTPDSGVTFGRRVMREDTVKGILRSQLIHPADGSRNGRDSRLASRGPAGAGVRMVRVAAWRNWHTRET